MQHKIFVKIILKNDNFLEILFACAARLGFSGRNNTIITGVYILHFDRPPPHHPLPRRTKMRRVGRSERRNL